LAEEGGEEEAKLSAAAGQEKGWGDWENEGPARPPVRGLGSGSEQSARGLDAPTADDDGNGRRVGWLDGHTETRDRKEQRRKKENAAGTERRPGSMHALAFAPGQAM